MENYLDECCRCPFFKYEDSEGRGWCDLMDMKTNCGDHCNYVECYEFMNPKRALKVLHYHQKWRRYNGKKQMKMVNGTLLGFAIDEAIRNLRKTCKETK